MSVASFHDVRLEIVRPGKPYNQLLSPLTLYMALCGEGSPVTFHIDFEHHQLMTRLDRLRYVNASPDGVARVPDRMRVAELAQLGDDVARILADIPTLSTALARAEATQQDECGEPPVNIVHMRLILSGSELALIPFELAIAPQGYPGEGVEFSLQSSLPIVVTREIHRDRPLGACWAQQGAPKILFVWAEPDGMTVPFRGHVRALRAAIEPWTRWVVRSETATDTTTIEEKRLDFVKQRLRLLPNASVAQIYEMCAKEHFTHVHILAHGDLYDDAGVQRFGIALCRDGKPGQKEVVSGKRLAKALLAEDAKGAGRSHPLVVTLATCDAGNQSQVLVPGGSIAHQLHGEGIPWVFASQFPLTKDGSVRMTQTLYNRLLRGDDPRQVLFEVRRELYSSGAHDHDWASIVAYAAVTANFDEEVADYWWAQTKRVINVCLDNFDAGSPEGKAKVQVDDAKSVPPAADGTAGRAEATAKSNERAKQDTVRMRDEAIQAVAVVREVLRFSRTRMPKGNSPHDRLRRAEIIGMHGSTFKRIALLMHRINDVELHEDLAKAYQEARDAYREAMDEAASVNDKYYWTATQYLSLCAVRGGPRDEKTHQLARGLAQRDLQSARDNSAKAWAHATIAELELLAQYHTGTASKRAVDDVVDHCRQIVALTGPGSFEIWSTLRQFKRYLEYWDDKENPGRSEIARAAVSELEPAAGAAEPKFPD